MKPIRNQKEWQAWAKAFPLRNGDQKAVTPIVFRNAEKTDEPLEILIYGEIGSSWWDDSGVSARDFAVALAPIPHSREIVVCINSPGGNVWDGWAIHNLLAARRDKVTCRVDGIAASIASVIALAGKECQMPPASMLMIHPASGLCMGTSDDMTEMAAALQKHTDVIAGVYQRKTGQPAGDIKAKMDAETWFTAEEAKDYGLCDTITGGQDSKPANKLSAGQVAGEIQNAATKPPAPTQDSGATTSIMNRTKIIALLNKLGIQFDDKASDDQLVALLDNHTPAAPPSAAPAAPAPAVDNATAEDMKAIKAELARLKESEITARIQACVDGGKLPASQMKAAIKRALADESYVAEVEALAPRVIGAEPVTIEVENEDPKNIVAAIKANRAPINSMIRGNAPDADAIQRNAFANSILIRNQLPRLMPILNTNTVDSDLKLNVLLSIWMGDFKRRIAPLAAFSTVFRNVPLIGTDKVAVPYLALDTTASKDFVQADGYEFDDDTTTGAKDVTVNKRKYKPLKFNSSELNRQPFLDVQRLGAQFAGQLGVDVFNDVLSVVTAANFGQAVKSEPAAAFSSDDVADIATVADRADWPLEGRSILLDSGYKGALLKDSDLKNADKSGSDAALRMGSVGKLSGFDIIPCARIPANSEYLIGMAVFPSAILVATSPVIPRAGVRRQLVSYDIVVDPDTGIAFEYRYWGDADADEEREVIECNYGYNVGQSNASFTVADLVPSGGNSNALFRLTSQ